MNGNGQTLGLCMIVRNEAPVIGRCLESVQPLIDDWLIVDTGSTDGTQNLVRERLRGLPGELVERPWVDFAHNRTEALGLARSRSDYVLTIDADEILERDAGFTLPHLTCDSYDLEVVYGGTRYARKQIVRSALPWRYEGVVHEYIRCDHAGSAGLLPGLRTVPRRDGARSRDPLTYRRDALALEHALLDDPGNARSVFYLAQSYRDAGDLELAVRHYRRRAEMGGWAEEVWCSKYQFARLQQHLERPWPEVMASYLDAHQHSPDRAEPLYRIAMHYQRQREHHLAYLFFARAMQIPPPPLGRLFVEQEVYELHLPLEYAVACYYVGRHAEAIATNDALLALGKVPEAVVSLVERNRRFSVEAGVG